MTDLRELKRELLQAQRVGSGVPTSEITRINTGITLLLLERVDEKLDRVLAALEKERGEL